jgi:dipeptidyl-peptidase-4
MKKSSVIVLLVFGFVLTTGVASPGETPTEEEMKARYERAAAVQAHKKDRWVLNQMVYPHWIDDHSFWYKQQTPEGHHYIVVDTTGGRVAEAFDHDALAAKLAEAVEKEVSADDLPIKHLKVEDDLRTVGFSAFGKSWLYDSDIDSLEEAAGKGADPAIRLSPDGSKAVFFKGFDIWMRDLASGEEKALTTDGEAFYAYGVVPDATGRPVTKPEAVWSPDSTRIFTAQTDDRQVLDLPMITFAPPDGSVRPTAWARRAALPGDLNVTQFRMVAIDLETGKQVAAHYPTLPATRMNDTPFGGNRAWWGADSRTAYFVEIERGEKTVRVVEFDTDTGSTRTVIEETSETYIDLASNVYGPAAPVPLPETNELVWYSERDGWAHLYLYDLATGKMVRRLTGGDWLVRDVVGVDAERRDLFFTLAGRAAGKDPYYREFARVDLDSAEITYLSASDADHAVVAKNDFMLLMLDFMGEGIENVSGVSPGGDYFVETVQRVDRPSTTFLCDRDGDEIGVIEKADASGVPDWWIWPEPVLLTAADGKTVISGAVFRPAGFSPDESYPVVDHIYGGPQVSAVPRSYDGQFGIEAASIAMLGFVAVVIDGRGTSARDKAFHDASYGQAHTASNLEDHIAGIEQLAERFPYMDADRVGIYGFSGGGYMTANAMLRFPEFFDVGVSGAGNHDQRLFWHSWGERYLGLLDGDNYLDQANLTYAENLQGKLLFIHGMLDHGVHPGGLFQLTQALMNANKDFDLVILPQAGHELPGYAMRRMWDYFVRHLGGNVPPPPMEIKSSSDLMKEEMMGAMAE